MGAQPVPEEPAQPPPPASFFGTGYRLDGSKIKGTESNSLHGGDAPATAVQSALGRDAQALAATQRAAAAEARIKTFQPGKLLFKPSTASAGARNAQGSAASGNAADSKSDTEAKSFKSFGGQGRSLR